MNRILKTWLSGYPLDDCTGFDWDDANIHNWERHRVTPEDAEVISFHQPLIVRSHIGHSNSKKRFYALEQTVRGQLMFAAFTIRGSMIRIISVREMHRKERGIYGAQRDPQ